MIWPNSVNNFIYTLFSSDSIIVSSNVSVDLNEQFNLDPNRTPWIGIYDGDINIEPLRVQINEPWMITYNPRIYVQGASFDSGQQANDFLNRTVTIVMTAINSNRSLGSTVDMIREWTVAPFERELENDAYFFTDEITITAEVRG